MPTVNASEFQRRIDSYSDVARSEPVHVTRDGRPSLVLLSAEDYARLAACEARATRAAKVADLPEATVAAMMQADLSHLPPD